MVKKILKKIAWGFAIFWGVLFLALGVFYIENHIVDDLMLPARNPDEIFTETHFQDSILQHTVKGEYFLMVKKYVEFMIVNGRDRYGKEHSPLFATALDRETGNAYKSNPPKAPKGIRDRDRTYRGANPSKQNGLYGLMYELTKITGDQKYAEEADKGIAWFWNNCQMPRTGLMTWGEHMGWDFFKERNIYWKFQFWLHEMKGYSHWDKVWEMTPEAAEKFAMGLWDNQIYTKEGGKAGEFSRHANSLMHYPFWGKGFPSHGGKYIEIWARAWQETGNEEFLRAINTLLNYFDKNTSPESGAIRYATKFPDQYSLGHNMGLAGSLHKSMKLLPDTFAVRMKKMADDTDPLYLSFDHDPVAGGKGFVKSAHVHTLVPGEYRSEHKGGRFRTQMWSSGYGAGNSIGQANGCLGRYNETGIEKYKELFMITAEEYYKADIPQSKILYPSNYSGVIGMMRKAYHLTGERRFIDKALEYAELSIEAIMDETSPLPKASNKSEHYEAITGANGFMNSLLGLWKDLNELE
jgi:hypothetical protein